MRPDLLEGGERDDEGVEAVEGGLHVDADAQRPHPQEHLEDEQPEEHEFGSVCGGKKREINLKPPFGLGIGFSADSRKNSVSHSG